MQKRLNISLDVHIVEKLRNKNLMATIHYPDEGGRIEIIKGLNKTEITEAITHEIGHLIDWYLSNEQQSHLKWVREDNAEIIGDSLTKSLN